MAEQGNFDMSEELNFHRISVDPRSPEPLYLQLADELNERIRRHEGEECCLPSQRRLAREIGCDRSTAARVYRELERRRVVEKRSAYKVQVRPEARLSRNPFPNIGVVVPRRFSVYVGEHNSQPLRYIAGITDRASEKNISTLMLQLPPPETPAKETAAFLDGIAVRLDGVIHMGERGLPEDPPLRMLMNDSRIPQVMISASPRFFPNIWTVSAAIETGARALAEKMRAAGLQKAGIMVYGETFASRGDNPYVIYESLSRGTRILKVFQEFNFVCEEEHLLTGCGSYGSIYTKLSRLVRRNSLPDLFWCQNDDAAVWCIEALERLNVRVPEDISVVGCDGTLAPPWDSRLTSIELPFYGLGCAAVDLLTELRTSGSGAAGVSREVPSSLVLKQSLGVGRSNSGTDVEYSLLSNHSSGGKK